MSYSLLGAHVNATVGGVAELIAQWKPPLVVILDHADVWLQAKLQSPKTTFVGRIYSEQQPDFNTTLDPINAANEHCAWLLNKIEQMGADRIKRTYDYWQGLNEPIVNSHDAMQRYADFEAERARILNANGFRVIVGSFSVGNPELAYWADFLPALEAARQYQGVLALHEYAWPQMDSDPEWLLLRHRKVYDGEPAHGWAGLPAQLKTLPLLITECGLDGLLQQPSPPRGWRTLYTPEQYLAQLDWYDWQLRQDPYVAGAAIYCCSYDSIQWQPYDIWPEAALELAQQATPVYPLYETPGPLPPPPPSPPLPEPTGAWQMTVEYQAGSRIIAGTFPSTGILLTVTDPWGNATQVESGSKPEYGVGGFEVLAPNVVTYTLAFLDQTFQVTTHDGATIVTFTETTTPAPPPPGDDLDRLLERLDEIIALLEERI